MLMGCGGVALRNAGECSSGSSVELRFGVVAWAGFEQRCGVGERVGMRNWMEQLVGRRGEAVDAH